ncbi:MAG TPA: YraN family protein [Phycisphaerae bacterium]|nr:YraN family protein [Phycisphaerae bacterium]HOJ75895.1 YraN family protein [Phycisphaerae bacterium]HOM52329.1 YraN family protein [Phycisphaerae bacterium]HON69315.1 YraN family protein [Phycisphaerae bacterium]HOQ87969.1 YraN family protein [Phycisphaerae bacterium]
MDLRSILGRSGERQAERFLRKLGYRTVVRNYRCPHGEIDLVMLDGATVVFVEVKTRTGDEHADPEDAVNPGKRQRMGRAARHFLRRTGSEHRVCRFDILAIVRRPDGSSQFEHYIQAFTPDE